MILPLHFCAAINCREMLIDPDEFMCTRHSPLISDKTVRDLVCATTFRSRIRAEAQALIEVAKAESTNCIRCVISPRTGPDLICDLCRNEMAISNFQTSDASQTPTQQTSPVTGDAGIQKESQS